MLVTSKFMHRWQQLKLLYDAKVVVPRVIRRQLRRIAAQDTPILLGPWLSEVGFELLYWIPFVRHLLSTYHIDPQRVTAISRGGAAPWYSDIAGHYVEIFDHVAPDQFLEANRQREAQAGLKKQLAMSGFDEQLLGHAAHQRELSDYDVIHPWWMYKFFSSYWRGWMYVDSVCAWCDHARLQRGRVAPAELPFAGDYVAAKFYFSDCFPDTPVNRRFVRETLGRLAQRVPVVLLNTGLQLDDHSDSASWQASNVFDATPLMTPANNLTVQTAIVAHATTLLSTYGGFSYLGPMLGKPCFSFYSTPNFVGLHLQLAHRVLNDQEHSFLAVLPTGGMQRFFDLFG